MAGTNKSQSQFGLAMVFAVLSPVGCIDVEADGALALIAKASRVASGLDAPATALEAGYVPSESCIPGIGSQWANPELMDADLDPDRPEYVLFRPTANADPSNARFLGIEYSVELEGSADSRPVLFGEALRGPLPGDAPGAPRHADLRIFLAPDVQSNESLIQVNPRITCPEGMTPFPEMANREDCVEQFGLFPISAQEAKRRLPKGFEPWGTGQLYVFSATCEKSSGYRWDEDLGRMVEFQSRVMEITAGIDVVPPPEFMSDHVSFYEVPLLSIVSDANFSTVFSSWHAPSVVGSVDFTLSGVTAASRTGLVTGTSSSGSLELRTGVGGPATVQRTGTNRVFGVWEGVVRNAFDRTWNASSAMEFGVATLNVQGNAVPQPTGPGSGFQYWGERYGYENAYVRLPS